jgi:CubicO group peptidase (beta-lactamase class C family)
MVRCAEGRSECICPTERFPLAAASASSLDLDGPALDRLQELITRHLAEGRYPGAQIALDRDGKLALFRTFGDARVDPARTPASGANRPGRVPSSGADGTRQN